MFDKEAFERLVYWITERDKIRRAKEAGLKKPWTQDPILQQYRFCNVRRMDDKVSRWLLDHWYQPNYDHKNILRACLVARLFNKSETLSKINVRSELLDSYRKLNIVAKLNDARVKGPIFNGAYIVSTNGLPGDKLTIVMDNVVQPVVMTPPILDTSSMESSVSTLCGYWGISTFMAGQIVADLRWAKRGPWADKFTWAAIGPGSRRGMNRLLNKPLTSPLTQVQFNPLLKRMQDMLRERSKSNSYLEVATAPLEAIDYQNCLCEFDKYERARTGEGRPKQKYQGV